MLILEIMKSSQKLGLKVWVWCKLDGDAENARIIMGNCFV